MVNDNGGTAVASDFTLSADGPTPISGTGAAINGPSFDQGTYALSETSLPGYSAGPWLCLGGTQDGASVTLSLGESATCTITNDDVSPKLIVFKHVVNDNGGTAAAGDFTMTVDGSSPDPAGFPGYEAGTMVLLNAGAYSVSEFGPAGYDASFSIDCTGTIDIGEMKACFVTNDDRKATPSIRTAQKWTLNDKAVLTGIRPGAPDATTATVLFTLFSDSDCTIQQFRGPAAVVDGIAETSTGYTTTTPGTYYWTALYSGDTYNEPRFSGCGSDITTITAVEPVAD